MMPSLPPPCWGRPSCLCKHVHEHAVHLSVSVRGGWKYGHPKPKAKLLSDNSQWILGLCSEWLINAFCESLKHVLFVYFPFSCWQSSSSFSSSPPFLSDCCVSWHLHATCRSAEKCETVGRNVHLIARVLTNKRHGDRTQSKTRRAFKFGIYLRWGDRSTTLTLHSRELLWTDNM